MKVQIVTIDKNSTLKNVKFNTETDELYKKCKFKVADNFICRHTWKVNHHEIKFIEMYGRDNGRANMENKYDLPPPIDTTLFFNTIAIVAKNKEHEFVDLSIESWEVIYEKLFGGFEDLTNTVEEDENEEDELDYIDDSMKTKDGYLKDGFVVDGSEDDSDEVGDYELNDNTSELGFEEYCYSSEEES
jgi:hypothetical protein